MLRALLVLASCGGVDADRDTFSTPRDCNDGDAAINPDAAESCNGIDDDCDGEVDESDAFNAPIWYADVDGDGAGDPAAEKKQCTEPAGHVFQANDCGPTDPAINPGGTERCNGMDDNCDGRIDESAAVDAVPWYADSDRDTYGNPDEVMKACAKPNGYVDNAQDCDDSSAGVSPRARESCNGRDDDCDGTTDEGTWFRDSDGDGYGGAKVDCRPNSPTVANAQDCDDSRRAVAPGVQERCNRMDDDCDGTTDEGCPQ
jgi:hypothetical protein